MVAEMTNRIVQGMREAVAHAQGRKIRARVTVVRVPQTIDVKAVRRKTNLTQRAFAERFGISLKTLRHWEQGLRVPEGPARVLLRVIEREPEAVTRALR
jgi:putative transcriptional regulator